MTLEKAIKLLALPRPIGTHPETSQPITAGIGRFGPYLKHGDIYKSLGREDDVLEIGINRAVEVLANAKGKTRTPGKTLGEHPADGKPVVQNSGRFGPYVSHNGVYANLPKGRDEVTFEEALALIAAKVAKGGGAKGGKTSSKSKTADAPAKAAKTTKAAPKPKATKSAAATAKTAATKTSSAKTAAAKTGKTAAKKPATRKASPKPDAADA